MDLTEIVAFAQRFWVVWLLVLFVGILARVFWPGRKQEMERYGRIPLDDGIAGDGRAIPEDGGVTDGRGSTGGKGE